MAVGKLLLFAGLFVALAGLAALIVMAGMRQSVKGYLYRDLAQAPAQPIAIVFGAGVWANGQLSSVLADRVDTAIDLYRAGKVRKLLMTGDNRFAWYNEPGAMAQYAQERGVPAEDIVYDYAGRRTYDSCYRARHIFGIERAILVTQEFHLSRAVYTCRRLGIEGVGAIADRQPYGSIAWFTAREMPALLVAWIQTNITHPVPVMGDPIPIQYD
jgi:SanA protein